MSIESSSSGRANVLVLGTADWGQPIATNQHYVVRELAEQTDASITYLESMGLRRPTLGARDLGRIWSRIGSALSGRRVAAESSRPTRPIPNNVQVISTLVVPVHTGVIKPINRALLLRQVKSWREARGARALVTYTPVTYGLESQADRSFYHCVDLLGAFPGIDADLVEREEQRLAKRGVIAIGSSPVVVSHLERMGFESPILMENVADVEVYKNAAVSQRRHGAVFAGNLSQHKLDCRLLNRLVDEGVELILAGPLAEGGGSTDQMKRLVRRQGVNYLGLLNPNELAQLLNASAVGLVPYLVNDYTRGVSPLKVYEYLASGLPVVSTAVPGVYPIDRDVYVETGDSFVEFVRRLSNQSITRVEVDRRVSVAEQHSWTVRGQEFRGLVFGNATHGRAS